MNDEEGRRRLKRFLIHLGIYFAATVLLVFVNLWVMPRDLAVIWPLLFWGVILALHAARLMGLWPERRPKP
ncbi:hypothetical protein GCM10011611_39380 [Aliidongia dinghuensis]|uniref:2TM domain-containing protein n=1 Tax=Aliidongia dinghuensis TaxID=1867774 RepID=A0A8J2YVX0_9PROT|nr:2TM domain-containing protein [Aliidongia dinghuensis]GGF29462.1 hypothetical protein GCM10011611_39380 [Aliidongia dinghuensis]